MLKSRLLAPLAGLLVLAGGGPLLAQPQNKGPELPVTRVVLFSSGVGFFQREGEVDGAQRVDLTFKVEDVNDLLKSLVLQDQSEGARETGRLSLLVRVTPRLRRPYVVRAATGSGAA